MRENRLSDPGAITEAVLQSFLDRKLFHVAVEGDWIAGFSAAEPDDGTIWALFVDPDAEGRGTGQALLNAALSDLRAAGHAFARLSTDPGTRAERFYTRAGWTPTGASAHGETGFRIALSG